MRKMMTGLVLGTGLLASSAASAEVLFTPPLVAEGKRSLDCYLANVGGSQREVTIQVLTAQGKVVKTVTTSLQPGEEKVARAAPDLLGRYCKFSVAGSKGDYRASVLVRQDGVGAISALPAS